MPPDVAVEGVEFAEAAAVIAKHCNDVEVSRRGFAVLLGGVPLVAGFLGRTARVDDGQGEGEFALEGIDGAAELSQRHGGRLLTFCDGRLVISRLRGNDGLGALL